MTRSYRTKSFAHFALFTLLTLLGKFNNLIITKSYAKSSKIFTSLARKNSTTQHVFRQRNGFGSFYQQRRGNVVTNGNFFKRTYSTSTNPNPTTRALLRQGTKKEQHPMPTLFQQRRPLNRMFGSKANSAPEADAVLGSIVVPGRLVGFMKKTPLGRKFRFPQETATYNWIGYLLFFAAGWGFESLQEIFFADYDQVLEQKNEHKSNEEVEQYRKQHKEEDSMQNENGKKLDISANKEGDLIPWDFIFRVWIYGALAAIPFLKGVVLRKTIPPALPKPHNLSIDYFAILAAAGFTHGFIEYMKDRRNTTMDTIHKHYEDYYTNTLKNEKELSEHGVELKMTESEYTIEYLDKHHKDVADIKDELEMMKKLEIFSAIGFGFMSFSLVVAAAGRAGIAMLAKKAADKKAKKSFNVTHLLPFLQRAGQPLGELGFGLGHRLVTAGWFGAAGFIWGELSRTHDITLFFFIGLAFCIF